MNLVSANKVANKTVTALGLYQAALVVALGAFVARSEEHTSELQSLV